MSENAERALLAFRREIPASPFSDKKTPPTSPLSPSYTTTISAILTTPVPLTLRAASILTLTLPTTTTATAITTTPNHTTIATNKKVKTWAINHHSLNPPTTNTYNINDE